MYEYSFFPYYTANNADDVTEMGKHQTKTSPQVKGMMKEYVIPIIHDVSIEEG